MSLNAKGQRIMRALETEYGRDARKVFWSAKKKNRIDGIYTKKQ